MSDGGSDEARTKPIRVAVVDDSAFVRKAVSRILETHPRTEVVGTASTGEELLEHLTDWSPDVITLDLVMPGIGGLQTLDAIVERRPVPVIILSTHSAQDAPMTLEALHRGALDFIDKQRYSMVDFQALGGVLIDKILQATGAIDASPEDIQEPPPIDEAPLRRPRPGRYEVVLIGASTGGPIAIQTLLEHLGAVEAPVLIVQHMPEGFTRAFADRLNQNVPSAVREAGHEVALAAASVHIAPAGRHLVLNRGRNGLETMLRSERDGHTHQPSVDVLFESALDVVGRKAIAILLTGMGSDGARGLLKLAEAGCYTLAQDATTSAIFGMPRAAIQLHAAREVLPVDGIARRVRLLLGHSLSS